MSNVNNDPKELKNKLMEAESKITNVLNLVEQSIQNQDNDKNISDLIKKMQK